MKPWGTMGRMFLLAGVAGACVPTLAGAAAWDAEAVAPTAVALYAQASESAAAGRVPEAIQRYVLAAKADPAHDTEALYRIASLLLEEQHADRAVQFFARVLERYPHDADALLGHAAAIARLEGVSADLLNDTLEELAAAEEDPDEAACAPSATSPAIPFIRSQLLYRLGDPQAALQAASEAVRRDAENPVSAAQTALYHHQQALCANTLDLLSPLE